ncbi:hypothetical protein BDV95DRAFT_608175 [Massariosphaeria phaeospora]|uniref:WW domain-containing protein n=1 Tax=Massariosphaeria phaeospora TaxID=100035 RepID=A0A7C8MLX9_9PLEO|nr:hypothetical protein BDV95DRAFT_608175 [Massariosphaeria phaeospora]
MATIPSGPPPAMMPLPAGWTEHTAPTGHMYYFHKETNKSTYVRPAPEVPLVQSPMHALPPRPPPFSFDAEANHDNVNPTAPQFSSNAKQQMQNLIFGGPPPRHSHQDRGQQQRGGHRGGFRGGHNSFQDQRRAPQDRPKHRDDIPNCAPWVLVRTKLGRRFVWNKDTNESFWKFPPDVMKGVVEFDRIQRERKERRERGEPSDAEDDAAMAEVEADLAAMEEEVEQQVVEVDGEVGMDDDEEYEEVEVTDDEGDEAGNASKRQRTEEPVDDQPVEMGEDDIAWQLAQMEAMEGDYGEEQEEEEEGLPLTDEDLRALFKELLDDTQLSPYTPWDKFLSEGALFEDERYKALPTMKARKDCFSEWCKERIQMQKEQKANQPKQDPKVQYMAFLDKFASKKLYWAEFRRKYRKDPEMKDAKLSDKEKETLYRDYVKKMR